MVIHQNRSEEGIPKVVLDRYSNKWMQVKQGELICSEVVSNMLLSIGQGFLVRVWSLAMFESDHELCAEMSSLQ